MRQGWTSQPADKNSELPRNSMQDCRNRHASEAAEKVVAATVQPIQSCNECAGLKPLRHAVLHSLYRPSHPAAIACCSRANIPAWVIGPFARPASGNPVISPNPASTFHDPILKKPVQWEALHTFNPAAIVRERQGLCALSRRR